jgi:hypothetical protein
MTIDAGGKVRPVEHVGQKTIDKQNRIRQPEENDGILFDAFLHNDQQSTVYGERKLIKPAEILCQL